MNLKMELDLIYEQVYMIKESVSDSESFAFASGFEDGINEGIGKWLGKAAGWVSDVPSKIKKGAAAFSDKARELYGKGKEMAAKAIEKIKDFSRKAIQSLKEKMSRAGEWISEKFESFSARMREAFDSIGKKIVEIWEATKDKSAKFWEATKDLFERMVEAMKKGYHSVREGLMKMGKGISEWVSKNWERLKAAAAGAKDRLSSLYAKAIEALRRGAGAAKKWIGVVALYLSSKFSDLKSWLAKIPELLNRYRSSVKAFIDREILEFKLGFEETSGRPWDRAKGFIGEKPAYPDVDVAPLKSEKDAKRHLALDTESSDLRNPHVMTPFRNVGEDSPLKSRGYSIAEIKAAAMELASDRVFAGKFASYSERDLKSVLRRENLSETAIKFVLEFFLKGKPKARKEMPLADSFRYIMTFESFRY